MLFFILFPFAREEKTALCVEMVKSSHLQQRNTNDINNNIKATVFRMRYVRQTQIKTQIIRHKTCASTKTTSLIRLFGKCFRHTSKPGHILYICIHTVFKLFQCFYCELGGVSSFKTRSVVLFFRWVIWYLFIQHPNLLNQEMFVAALLQAKDAALNEWRLVIRMKIKKIPEKWRNLPF